MKAVIISKAGGPEVLQLAERPIPELGASDVLIKVMAAGVNRPDLIQRQGRYPAPPGVVADIPGLEVAGIIEQCGSEVKRWKTGDAVCALLAGGGYAEYACVNEGQCLPVPANYSFIEAASLPETIFTVWHNVFKRGTLKAGETLLVHGGSSGIGVAAIQLAKAFGANVLATAGSAEKCEACIKLGAAVCINYKENDFEELLKHYGADVVLDMVGGNYFGKNIRLLNEDGRLVYINAMEGAKVEANIMTIMQKRLTITGSTLRARTIAFKASLATDIEQNVWPLLRKQFNPLVFKTFYFDNAASAHELMENSGHIGKIVLVPK